MESLTREDKFHMQNHLIPEVFMCPLRNKSHPHPSVVPMHDPAKGRDS
jgi:hypothetical protein